MEELLALPLRLHLNSIRNLGLEGGKRIFIYKLIIEFVRLLISSETISANLAIFNSSIVWSYLNYCMLAFIALYTTHGSDRARW